MEYTSTSAARQRHSTTTSSSNHKPISSRNPLLLFSSPNYDRLSTTNFDSWFDYFLWRRFPSRICVLSFRNTGEVFFNLERFRAINDHTWLENSYMRCRSGHLGKSGVNLKKIFFVSVLFVIA